MIEEKTDILIIGGGLTGASLLLALKNSPWTCQMVDAGVLSVQEENPLEARSLALAPASLRILTQLGVGEDVKAAACPINSIHVSQQGAFGRSCLHAKTESLGHVIAMNRLNQILLRALPEKSIDAPARCLKIHTRENWAEIENAKGTRRLHYKILVAADGAQSTVRKQLNLQADTHDYQQHGLVTNIELARDHQHRAYERFTANGPLALLPLEPRRMALVWAMHPDTAKTLLETTESAFLQKLQRHFGYRLGRFTAAGPRSTYPLYKVVSTNCIKDNAVLIGSAAQHLHPVAGQGFNLALRDTAALAQSFYQHGLQPQALQQYAAMREQDRRLICRFTDGLVRLFSARLPGLPILRGLGLLAFDNLPPLQDALAHYARGFGGTPPDLACGIALDGALHEH